MNCEEVEKDMIDYLDRTLEGNRREEVEKHLETCERCMDEVQDLQKVLHTISDSAMEKPDGSLRINFYHMLHSEINKQNASNQKRIAPTLRNWSAVFQKVAAALALLIAGAFLGMLIQNPLKTGGSSAELKQMKTEVNSIKQMMMFKMLNEDSPSERIKAVNYAEEIPGADENVLGALVKTLNRDKNVNVRLAAAYSLAKFSDRKSVRDSLVESLAMQTDPIIQIVLMNILVEKKERSAVKSIQQVISNKNTLKEVKEAAQKSIKVLL
jgi:hypothetical protein